MQGARVSGEAERLRRYLQSLRRSLCHCLSLRCDASAAECAS